MGAITGKYGQHTLLGIIVGLMRPSAMGLYLYYKMHNSRNPKCCFPHLLISNIITIVKMSLLILIRLDESSPNYSLENA
jgi:hypothetical protein